MSKQKTAKCLYVLFQLGNLVILSYGSFVGWQSPALPLLTSPDTPLKTGPLSNADVAWIGCAPSIGAVIGTFLCAFLNMKYGSKIATTCCAFPLIAFWIIIYFGDTFYYVFAARFIGGMTAGGFQSGIVAFAAEISNDK